MKIYVAHSSNFDFKTELYAPLRNSDLNKKHEITLPHEDSSEQFDSKNYFKDCDLVIAEVTYPSTGMGIELGWADYNNVKVICIYKYDAKVSGALKAITNDFIEYYDSVDLVNKLQEVL